MITRLVENSVYATLTSASQLVLLLGPRQAGKTTLLSQLKTRLKQNGVRSILSINCDSLEDRAQIDTTSLTQLKTLLANTQVLMVDEAQRLTDPGLTLKIIHDQLPHIRVIATGSSSLQLKHKTSEPMTGRYRQFTLYPLSFAEIISSSSLSDNNALETAQAKALLPTILTYGMYPACVTQPLFTEKQHLLTSIQESYLFKDILTFQKVRSPETLVHLTQALAYQVGSEVNTNDLSKRLGIDAVTIRTYISLLEQTYVIVQLTPYARNLRKEIGKKYKVYFVDIGLRNALIGDFKDLSLRTDAGAVWENFFIMERMKRAANADELTRYHFWRTYNGAEVDLIEKPVSGSMRTFECKYSSPTLSRGAHSFREQYAVPVQLINQTTYFPFVK